MGTCDARSRALLACCCLVLSMQGVLDASVRGAMDRQQLNAGVATHGSVQGAVRS